MKKSDKVVEPKNKKLSSIKLINNAIPKSVNINLKPKDKSNNLLLNSDNKKLSDKLNIKKKPLIKKKSKNKDSSKSYVRKFSLTDRTRMRNAKYLEARMFTKEQELLNRELDIKKREANLAKWNVPDIHKNYDVSKAIVLFIRGKIAVPYDAIMYHDHIRVPKLKMRWLISPNQEDLNTVFSPVKHGITGNSMIPMYIGFEGKKFIYPLDELCIEEDEEDGEDTPKTRLKFYINGKFDNEMFDLMMDKNVTNAVFRPKHDWVMTMTVALIVALNEYTLLKGDNATEKEQLMMMGIFSVLFGFLMWWNSRSLD